MNALAQAAEEILKLFPYGPHFTAEQNRALASLRAAVEQAQKDNTGDLWYRINTHSQQFRELNDAVEQLQVWQCQQEQQDYGRQIAGLRDEIERMSRRLEG